MKSLKISAENVLGVMRVPAKKRNAPLKSINERRDADELPRR